MKRKELTKTFMIISNRKNTLWAPGLYKHISALVNPYSAGIDFKRQNLTSVDARFWRLFDVFLGRRHNLNTIDS